MKRYIYKQLYYGKTISSFDALRPLFSSGFFNFICKASRNNKRFELCLLAAICHLHICYDLLKQLERKRVNNKF